MPRVILAGLVGASLAIAGAAFQGIIKNPLADPYTLGVSSGASVGAVATLFFGISVPFLGMYTLPVFSMIGAFGYNATRYFICEASRSFDENGDAYINRYYF